MDKGLVEEAATLFLEAKHAVALTGAGHSTPSGIPDFRSPGSGLWSQVDPMEVASIQALYRDPEAIRSIPVASTCPEALSKGL